MIGLTLLSEVCVSNSLTGTKLVETPGRAEGLLYYSAPCLFLAS